MSAQVIIYTSDLCGFCYRAKMLLDHKAVVYKEISVDGNPQVRQQMTSITGGRTVPQIIINNKPIGGCDEIFALERSNQLDDLLI